MQNAPQNNESTGLMEQLKTQNSSKNVSVN